MKKFYFVTLVFLIVILVGSVVAQDEAMSGYTITVEPIGHWHIFQGKTLQFTVQNSDSSLDVEGLEVVAEIARTSSDSVSVRSVAEGQITDEGEGIYTLEYTPSVLDSYALVVHFTKGGQTVVSSPVPFETSRAGEEGIRVAANETEYVYQIRYNMNPGHIHADNEITFTFELLRGISTGDDINWEQPWTNVFDHVTNVESASINISSEDGEVVEDVELVYMGRGIYEAVRPFSHDEVGDGRDYTLTISFTDAFNSAEVSLSEPAHLHASASH